MEKEKKTLHDHFRVIENLLFIGFIIMIIPALFPLSVRWTGILMFLGFGIMVAAVIYQSKYYKCPHCGAKLDPRRKVPNFCPNCGEKLS